MFGDVVYIIFSEDLFNKLLNARLRLSVSLKC